MKAERLNWLLPGCFSPCHSRGRHGRAAWRAAPHGHSPAPCRHRIAPTQAFGTGTPQDLPPPPARPAGLHEMLSQCSPSRTSPSLRWSIPTGALLPMGEPPAHTAAHFGALVGAGPHCLWGSSGRNMGGAGHAAPTRPASVTELPFLGIQHLVKEKQKHHAENAFLVTSH